VVFSFFSFRFSPSTAMKSFLFAALASASLLAGPSAFATSFADNGRYEQGPGDRNFNYGYDRNHRVTREEIARYQAQHRSDNRGRDNDHRDNDRRDNDRRDDHFDRNKNYGFDRDHRVTRDERRDWERSHNYGYAQNHRVTPQERARWEAQYRR
jgi:hypothetical protein